MGLKENDGDSRQLRPDFQLFVLFSSFLFCRFVFFPSCLFSFTFRSLLSLLHIPQYYHAKYSSHRSSLNLKNVFLNAPSIVSLFSSLSLSHIEAASLSLSSQEYQHRPNSSPLHLRALSLSLTHTLEDKEKKRLS